MHRDLLHQPVTPMRMGGQRVWRAVAKDSGKIVALLFYDFHLTLILAEGRIPLRCAPSASTPLYSREVVKPLLILLVPALRARRQVAVDS